MSVIIGNHGEDLAVVELENHGYKIIERNYRTRFGEIDIVALDNNTIVFVEVKLRSYQAFGGGTAAITKEKLRKILITAKHYLFDKGWSSRDFRIDAVIIDDGRLEILRNIYIEGL